jgi:thiol-disulfide isomerase/thioredoxin
MKINLTMFLTVVVILSIIALLIFLGFNALNTAQQNTDRLNNPELYNVTDEDELPVSYMVTGDYIKYSFDELKGQKNILFFTSESCESCMQFYDDVQQNQESIPDNIRILEININNELSSSYWVRYPHTFVQVDSEGNFIKKWSDSNNLEGFLKKLFSYYSISYIFVYK